MTCFFKMKAKLQRLEEDRKDLVFYLHKNRQEIEKVEEELKKYKK